MVGSSELQAQSHLIGSCRARVKLQGLGLSEGDRAGWEGQEGPCMH